MEQKPNYRQPTYVELQTAYIKGAEDARENPSATPEHFERAADAFCKLIHSHLDPVFFEQLNSQGKTVMEWEIDKFLSDETVKRLGEQSNNELRV